MRIPLGFAQAGSVAMAASNASMKLLGFAQAGSVWLCCSPWTFASEAQSTESAAAVPATRVAHSFEFHSGCTISRTPIVSASSLEAEAAAP